jgi:hypothetical protein
MGPTMDDGWADPSADSMATLKAYRLAERTVPTTAYATAELSAAAKDVHWACSRAHWVATKVALLGQRRGHITNTSIIKNPVIRLIGLA